MSWEQGVLSLDARTDSAPAEFEIGGHPPIFFKKAKRQRNKTKLALVLKHLFKYTGMFQLQHLRNLNRIYLFPCEPLPGHIHRALNSLSEKLRQGNEGKDAEGTNV